MLFLTASESEKEIQLQKSYFSYSLEEKVDQVS